MNFCYVSRFKLLIINTKTKWFFWNLGNKQLHLESTLAWIWSTNLWLWSLFLCLRSWRFFQERLDYISHDVFASCKVWFEVAGTRLWTKPRASELERTSTVPFLSHCIQGGESATHSRQAATDPIFVRHSRVGVLMVPKCCCRRKDPTFLFSCHVLRLMKCEQWWEREPFCFLGTYWYVGIANDI